MNLLFISLKRSFVSNVVNEVTFFPSIIKISYKMYTLILCFRRKKTRKTKRLEISSKDKCHLILHNKERAQFFLFVYLKNGLVRNIGSNKTFSIVIFITIIAMRNSVGLKVKETRTEVVIGSEQRDDEDED